MPNPIQNNPTNPIKGTDPVEETLNISSQENSIKQLTNGVFQGQVNKSQIILAGKEADSIIETTENQQDEDLSSGDLGNNVDEFDISDLMGSYEMDINIKDEQASIADEQASLEKEQASIKESAAQLKTEHAKIEQFATKEKQSYITEDKTLGAAGASELSKAAQATQKANIGKRKLAAEGVRFVKQAAGDKSSPDEVSNEEFLRKADLGLTFTKNKNKRVINYPKHLAKLVKEHPEAFTKHPEKYTFEQMTEAEEKHLREAVKEVADNIKIAIAESKKEEKKSTEDKEEKTQANAQKNDVSANKSIKTSAPGKKKEEEKKLALLENLLHENIIQEERKIERDKQKIQKEIKEKYARIDREDRQYIEKQDNIKLVSVKLNELVHKLIKKIEGIFQKNHPKIQKH